MMIATITPKIPSADPKISTIRIFTKRLGSWASASAQLEPATPTPAKEGGAGLGWVGLRDEGRAR